MKIRAVLITCLIALNLSLTTEVRSQPAVDTAGLMTSLDAYMWGLDHGDAELLLTLTPDTVLSLIGGPEIFRQRLSLYPLTSELSGVSTFRRCLGFTMLAADSISLNVVFFIGIFEHVGNSFTEMAYEIRANSFDGINWKMIYLPLLTPEICAQLWPVNVSFPPATKMNIEPVYGKYILSSE